MGFFRNKEQKEQMPIQWKISRSCFNLLLEVAKSSYPNEFGGLLRADTKAKDTIVELVLLPGTISGGSSALFQLHMLPIDYTIVGTIHSHPSGIPLPSDEDFFFFNKYGRIHIIVASPFSDASWNAFDFAGKKQTIDVIDD
jgi:proteasome lid subunit RPN8/RPN11